MRFDGLNRLMRIFATRTPQTVRKFQRGMMKAGLLIQRESQKIVPVDTSALKNSARTVPSGYGFAYTVTISYSTHYAVYVHEDLNMRHKPGKVAKFLEIPFRSLRREILAIIIGELQS